MDIFNLGVVVALLIASAVRTGASPVTAIATLWGLVFAVRAANPLDLTVSGPLTSLVVLSGISATVLPSVVAPRASGPPVGEPNEGPRFRVGALVGGYLLCLSFGLYGAFVYRSTIQRLAGTSFGDLTPEQIRSITNGSARDQLGLWPALASLLVVATCIAIMGALVHSRAWFVGAAAAMAATLQSTSRTALLGSIVTAGAFYLYVRQARKKPRRADPTPAGRQARWRTGVMIAVALAACVVVFERVGSQLGKSDAASAAFPAYPWPNWTLSGVLYQSGGVSALDVALSNGQNPYTGTTSFYAPIRILNLVGFDVSAGDTIARYSFIPAAFNVYTGYGQLYFDGGLIAVIVTSLIFGVALLASHRKALRGEARWALVAAVLLSVGLSLTLGFRLFNLDTILVATSGFVLLTFASPARRSRKPYRAVVAEKHATLRRERV